MISPKDQIVALLPKLSAADLVAVGAALKFISAVHSAAPEPDLTSDWLICGIATYLIKRDLIARQGALWALRKRDAYKKDYLHKIAPVAAFLAKIETEQLKSLSRHRPQLAMICAVALGDWLERRNIFSVSAMLSQIDKLPEALEESYPSYIRAGLFGFVLRTKE